MQQEAQRVMTMVIAPGRSREVLKTKTAHTPTLLCTHGNTHKHTSGLQGLEKAPLHCTSILYLYYVLSLQSMP